MESSPAGHPATPPAEAPGPGRRLRLLGMAVAVIALGLCGWALVRDWDRVSAAIAQADPIMLTLGAVASAVSMIWLALLWHRCLLAMGVSVSFGDVLSWYFIGELGKYLPGGVWQIVGRSELAHQQRGVRRTTSYASTLLAYGVMCLGAVLVCALAAPWLATGSSGTGWAWLLVPGLVLVPLVIHPSISRALQRIASRLTRRTLSFEPLPWSTMLSLLLWSVPAWVLLGAASGALSVGLDTGGSTVRIALAAVVAWVVGFLAVAVPAGAGVREVVFVTFSGLAAGPAVAVALLARLLLIGVDAAGGVLAMVVNRVQTVRRRS